MVGGKKEHLDTCLPVMEAMGSRVEHMGGWGAGAAAKLVNQVCYDLHHAAAAAILCCKK